MYELHEGYRNGEAVPLLRLPCRFKADYLPIRTVLGNRYLVGKLLEYNGDGATYMGLDLSTREPVNIREFFPEGIALRDSKTLGVYVAPGNENIFNAKLH